MQVIVGDTACSVKEVLVFVLVGDHNTGGILFQDLLWSCSTAKIVKPTQCTAMLQEILVNKDRKAVTFK